MLTDLYELMKKVQRGGVNLERKRPFKKLRGNTAESIEALRKEALAVIESFEFLFNCRLLIS
jgi:hypothetical protein